MGKMQIQINMIALSDRVTNCCFRKRRKGSALLLCTLVTAVLSMSAIAILRSSQLAITRVESTRNSVAARHAADGFVQRAVSILKSNPTYTGKFAHKESGFPNAFCETASVGTTQVAIRVYLYDTAKVPVIERVIDLAALNPAAPTSK